MATRTENDPEDPGDLDPLPGEPEPRPRDLPKGDPDRESRSGAPSRSDPKKEFRDFRAQERRKTQSLDDLSPVPEGEAPSEKDPLRQAASSKAAAGVAGGVSGREREEELRREAGRLSTARPTDFEPRAWESSRTRLDAPDAAAADGLAPRVGFGTCLASVWHGLKTSFRRLKLIEMISVTAFLIVALLALVAFRGLVHSGQAPETSEARPLAALTFPLEGDLLNISAMEATWRPPQPGDIVRPGYALVPEVSVTMGSGNGFLRVLFRDQLGKIQGDPVAVQVENGKINGQSTHEALCSVGYANPMNLIECQAGRLDPWTIYVYESRVYDVPIGEWRSLATFAMPCHRAR